MYSNFFKVSISFLMIIWGTLGCSREINQAKSVYLYTTRHYDVDKNLYKKFEQETGIKVHIVKEKADSLILRMEKEKSNPQADIFLATGYSTIHKALAKNLVEPISSQKLLDQTLPRLRDSKKRWYALSSRLRIIVIDKDYEGDRPRTYWDLSHPRYQGQILTRSGLKNYNVSWVAYLISIWGEEKTREFLKNFVINFARSPEGKDRKQISDIYAKKGSLSIVNSYYLGRMLNSKDQEEKKAVQSVQIIYPEDGIHEDISGFCLIKNAKNKKNALKLVEFMTSKSSQEKLTNENFEYPVNPEVQPTDVFLQWGEHPLLQDMTLEFWGSKYELAMKLITESGWV